MRKPTLAFKSFVTATASDDSNICRAAVHSGKMITWDEMYHSNFQFIENIDEMDYGTEPPVTAGPDGFYPVPIPGEWSET